jgi:UDP-N-acetylmuramyl pentapeptide phosphotransferase/UDP-N-acetylglucosamine-1-phosphate transferase
MFCGCRNNSLYFVVLLFRFIFVYLCCVCHLLLVFVCCVVSVMGHLAVDSACYEKMTELNHHHHHHHHTALHGKSYP